MLISKTMEPIKRGYSTSFFRWPIEKGKEKKAILEWKSDSNLPIIIYHPHLNFDPISNFSRRINMIDRERSSLMLEMEGFHGSLNDYFVPKEDKFIPIIHESIKVYSNFFENIKLLLSSIEFNSRVPKDNWLWDDTGFWSAKSDKNRYMGLSEESAFNLWDDSKDLLMSLIISSPSTLLEITLDKLQESSFDLDIYYSNRFVAFPDRIRAVHESLNNIGKWKSIKIEKDNYDIIFGTISHQKSMLQKEKKPIFYVKPEWVIPLNENPEVGTDWLYAVIVKNTFFSLNKGMNKPEGYAFNPH